MVLVCVALRGWKGTSRIDMESKGSKASGEEVRQENGGTGGRIC